MSAFATVINGRYNVCHPDSISITWHNAHNDEKLFEHTFPVISRVKPEIVVPSEQGVQRVQYGLSGTGRGLGEAEVNHLVEKRISEMQQVSENNRLKEENNKYQNKIAELEKEKEALEKSIKAKSNIEYFITIIGSAFPDLGKVMAGADIFKQLKEKKETKLPLTGTSSTQQAPNEQAVIELLEEYMRTELNERELASMYLLFLEFQKDKSLIQKLLEQVTKTPSPSHAPTT
jgi:hypothetical protein